MATTRQIGLEARALGETTRSHLIGQSPARDDVHARLNEAARSLVRRQLEAAPRALREAVTARLGKLDVEAAAGLTMKELLLELTRGSKPDPFLDALTDKTTIGELLMLDIPLEKNPHLADLTRRAFREQLLRLTPLRDDAAAMGDLLAAFDANPHDPEKALRNAVEAGRIRPEAAADVEATLRLAAVIGPDPDLVRALKARKIAAAAELARFSTADWAQILEADGIAPPPSAGGISAGEYAARLTAAVGRAFPTLSLARQLAARLRTLDEADLETVARVLDRHPNATYQRGALAGVPWGSFSQQQRRDIETAAARVGEATASFGELGVDAALNDRTLGPAERIDQIKDAVDHLGVFFKANPGIDLRAADLHGGTYLKPGAAAPTPLAWDGIGKDRPRVLKQLKAYQRVLRVHEDPEVADRLLAKGFDSARKIADQSEAEFLRRWAGDPAQGHVIYHEASGIAAITALAGVNAREAAGGLALPGAFYENTAPELLQYFRSIPGFTDLFALPAFCDCAHCKSMFGPAAYFVDLMRFIDLHVTQANPAIPAGLTLRDRRPDLWQIPLDCDNTNRQIPYLDIVNEVLEARMRGTYGVADPHRALLQARHPLSLPFNLPLARTRAYLGHFRQNLEEIFRVYGSGARHVATEALGLSREMYQVITTPAANDAALAAAYGFPPPAAPVPIVGGGFWQELVRVDRFLLHTGLKRPELIELLFQNLSEAERAQDVQQSFYINNVNNPGPIIVGPALQPSLRVTTITADPADVHEEFQNLSNQKLDRIHRFVRLARALGWSFADLDWVLRSLGKTAPDRDIDEEAIIRLARIKRWQERFKIPLDVLTSLWFDLKGIGQQNADGPAPADLFNRTFNHPDVLAGRAPYTGQPLRFLDPNDARDPNRTWLLAALEVTDADLGRLVGAPAGLLALSRPILSFLYRATRLPKLLGLTMRDYLDLLALLGINDPGVVRDFATLERVIDAADWVRESGFTVQELRALRRKRGNEYVRLTDSEPDIRQLADDLAASLAANIILEAAFTALDGVTAAQSAALFDDLVANGFIGKAAPADRQGRLTDLFRPDAPGFTLQPLRPPFDVAAAEQRVIAVLRPRDPKQIVLDRLGAFLGLDPAMVRALVTAAGYSLDDALLLRALTTRIPPGPIPQLLTLFLENLRAYQLLLREVPLEPDEIAHITAQPGAYNIDSLGNLSFDNVQRLQRWSRLIRMLPDPRGFPAFFDGGTRAERIARLAVLLHQDRAAVLAVVDAGWPIQPPAPDTRFANATDVLTIHERLAIAAGLGVAVERVLAWAAWNDGGWPEYVRLAEAALETVKAKYGEAEWKAAYGPLHDGLREQTRDALAAYVLAGERGHGVHSLTDLYKYFLLDVETSSCATISRVALGILSAQHYVQRCRMKQEREVDPATVPETQWQWMKSYRVWEANRRVFLYPENYILPELRDDRTSLFRELQDELVQNELTAVTAENAYRNYLNRFAEVANLKIAGAYHDAPTSTLFLIGRTKTEPRAYYYRTCRNEVTWTPWEKIELTIKADVASPLFTFGRLFLFWVERQRPHPEQQGLRGVIKYSYYDFRGRWTPPQTMRRGIYNVDIVFDPAVPRLTQDIHDRVYNSLVYPYRQPRFIRVATYDTLSGGYVIPTYLFYDFRELTDLPDPLNHPRNPYSFLAVDRYANGNVDQARILEVASAGPFREEDHYFAATREANFEDASTRHPGFIVEVLGQVPYLGTEVKIVNNQPEWFVLDADAEEFLVKKRLDPAYQDLLDAGLDPAGGPFRFYFERITTDTVHAMSERLFTGGLDGLLSLDSQRLPELPFADYHPTSAAALPVRDLDFKGAHASYFWEIFFHIPLLIANQLTAAQRFEDAQKWYHYVFDPTVSQSEPFVADRDRYWRFLPLRNLRVQTFRDMLSDSAALAEYHDHPFQPHAIARLRLSAYQKTVVMRYIDNLIAWAEARFAENRWESLTEATLLYLLAAEILGGRPPAALDACTTPPTRTYQQIADAYAGGSHIPEFWVEVENAPLGLIGPMIRRVATATGNGFPRADSLLYFCFPENGELREYWRRVEDGLYKIRHCLNIAGVKTERALYDPPIDPMALVRAAAGGRDLSSVLAELVRPVPHYRFAYLLERARGVAAQVQQLGGALLSALEKQDAEQLARLRSTHELKILDLTLTLREHQQIEAAESYNALLESKRTAQARLKHYQGLLSAGSLPSESLYFSHSGTAKDFDLIASIGRVGAAVARLVVVGIPDGEHIGPSLEYAANAFSAIAGHYNTVATIASVKASLVRRAQDWALQVQLAQREIEQLDRQLEAARARRDIAAQEHKIQLQSITQAEAQDTFLRDKFTDQELYQWMAGRLAGAYFQAYRLAYDLAKAAEKALHYERNLSDTYVNFGHWDSLKKGLLAGEMLMLELAQLEKAALDGHARTLEIEKTIPLSQLPDDTAGSPYPTALIALRETGACEFTLTNTLFEQDYPGHYARQIKTVALSVPAVIGPYEHLKATLTQLGSSVLTRPDPGALLAGPNADSMELDLNSLSVRSGWRAQQQIALSSGVNDSGMFQLNFGDERYLPFEGTGARSSWRLEIPRATNTVDFATVSDVLMHLRYTARFDGGLRRAVENALRNQRGYTLISLRPEQSTGWHRFLHPNAGAPTHELTLALTPALLPPNASQYRIDEIFVKVDLAGVPLPLPADLPLALTPGAADPLNLAFRLSTVARGVPANGSPFGSWRLAVDRRAVPSPLRRRRPDGTTLTEDIGGVPHYQLDPERLRNIEIVLAHTGVLRP